jgi:transcriptional regulator with XRE-family HTH domain
LEAVNISATSDATAKVPVHRRRKLLRAFRKQYGITLTEFGKVAGLSNPMLSQFENRARVLSDEAWSRVLAAMSKLLSEDEAKRKRELAKAEQTATKLGVFGGLFGGQQDAEHLREYLRAQEVWKALETLVRAHLGQTATAEALSEEINLRIVIPQQRYYVKVIEQERAQLLEVCDRMGDWFGKLEENILSAQKLNREEVAGLATGLQQAREQLLAIRAKAASG